MVNGGGAITLQFQRSPFRPMTRTVFVPWNQVNYHCHCVFNRKFLLSVHKLKNGRKVLVVWGFWDAFSAFLGAFIGK